MRHRPCLAVFLCSLTTWLALLAYAYGVAYASA
jgi:hypothetical protein